MTPSEREEIRAEICEAISQMLDAPDDVGVYPTTRCFNRLENFILTQVAKARAEAIEECAKIVDDWNDCDCYAHREDHHQFEIACAIRNKLNQQGE